ncbi:tetratricopeptide repeat protein [Sphingomonas sp. MS122]|uniref:tetratricopeptide repeat protein n=1 Tax=Sphingomonas sp. MS122 TaxID=3412683 RepID=UPI003C2DC020
MRLIATLAAVAALAAAMPTAAQTGRGTTQGGAIEGRVDRLEREMRAVQRKVFPGGAGQTIEPQIIPPQQPQTAPGLPATSVVADLNARVSAMESQLSQMTGQIEQSQYRVRQLEEAFNAYKRSTDARLKVLESGAAPAETEEPVTGATRPGPARPAVGGPATPAVSVERPKSDDPAEDGYVYGYRLWQAKQYDKAIPELRTVVQKYPKHRRASYSQNLLGRALLDQGKPALAATAFFESYQKMPNGERAPDSLYYLAQALVKMKKPASEVCKVYDELTQVYGDRLSEAMKMDVATGRSASKCK